MTLVPGASLLLDARKRKYAIPQFNVLNLEMIDAVLSTAEELKAPVVVGIVDRHFPVLDVESLVSAIKKKAQTMEASVILHLDHGRTYERAMEAIRMGFTSVMYDGSLLPIEENIQITNAIIKTAHAVGVSVEAELGHVGSQNAGDENKVTSVSDAVEFVQRTNVDYLAISIGNTHGHYYGENPSMNLNVLKKIADQVSIPLVLHGGSETPVEEIRKVINLGIAKINIFTEFARAYLEGIKELSNSEKIDYLDLASYGKRYSQEIVQKKFEDFNTIQKHADLCRLLTKNSH